MAGEGKHKDYKLHFDPTDGRALVDLIKNLVAMANAGGGEIIIGRDETTILGVDESAKKALDSARIADKARHFITPAQLQISHEIDELEDDRFVVTLSVEAAKYPIVMARQGDWKGMDSRKDKSLFLQGDIWIRHSSKTERIRYEELKEWIDRIRQEERELILSRITKVIDLPEGAEIQVVAGTRQPIDTPKRLLEYAVRRHAYDPDHLLSAKDLVHLFINRDALGFLNEEELRLLVASALRRPPTLFWWLIQLDAHPNIILEEVEKCLQARDRDKSDAAKSVIELAAIFADDTQLDQILGDLRTSGYKHFQTAAANWVDRTTTLNQLRDRISRARHGKRKLQNFSVDELEKLATEYAVNLQKRSTSANSRKLGDITRVIWSKKSRYGQATLT